MSLDGDRAVIETTPGTKIAFLKGSIRNFEAPAKAEPVAKAASTATKKPAAKKPAAKSAAKKPAAK